MDLILTRNEKNKYGIFSTLSGPHGFICNTLEHAYPQNEKDENQFEPKLKAGTYRCVKGMHRLDHSLHPFETFEVTEVPGHSGILFHTGNTNSDSQGCICVGVKQFEFIGEGAFIPVAVVRSRAKFESFLELLKSLQEFRLTVIDPTSPSI